MNVKLRIADGQPLVWAKSTYSTDDGPACVEVAATPRAVHVRDSKRAEGPLLTVPPTNWSEFIRYVTD
ncbi:DUF397 domain-containing protein [Streptomyces durbertensis]|uniref:DUF397 domain-containing protein n=1 Tax=Streptomyces durbertensis TaxID=2448886 RepID=A0ABR6EMK6_9ACTN|nr:DUF397 domain-containing protein [Streptomyces durbertensis]MBB1246571.1 DUF397 domain-containing protein [Streptomyces durbertensis]